MKSKAISRLLAICAAALFLPLGAFAADVAILNNGFTIRHERREVMGDVTRLYTNTKDGSFVDVPTSEIVSFEKDLTPAPASATAPASENSQPLPDLVNEISGRHHLDPDLINSVIHAESNFNSHAVSRKGAQGLMQLMPQTASQLGVQNSFDANSNVEGGTKYLRELLERYNFDLIKALAAYNAGPQRVDRYRGVPPYDETHAYVARIIRDFNRKKLAERQAVAAKKTAVKKVATSSKPKPALAAQSGSHPLTRVATSSN
jgi:soluble lytic murein transglycosylase-like protein